MKDLTILSFPVVNIVNPDKGYPPSHDMDRARYGLLFLSRLTPLLGIVDPPSSFSPTLLSLEPLSN